MPEACFVGQDARIVQVEALGGAGVTNFSDHDERRFFGFYAADDFELHAAVESRVMSSDDGSWCEEVEIVGPESTGVLRSDVGKIGVGSHR